MENLAHSASFHSLDKNAPSKPGTKHLVEAGALVDKNGLLDPDSNALHGALLSLRDGADDKAQLEQWAALGGRAFDREARARDAGKEPLLLTFTAPLLKNATTALRCAGFRYSRVLQHWEGVARLDEAGMLAKTHGGTAGRVGAAAGSPEGGQAAEAAE